MTMSRRWTILTEPLKPPFDATRAVEHPILDQAGAALLVAETLAEWRASAPSADAVLHWRTHIGPAEIALLKRCRVIVHYGVGVDRIDFLAAAAAGIYVANVPRYGVSEVADHAMALLLASVRKLRQLDSGLRRGEWGVHRVRPVHRIMGRTLGIVGLGNIGAAVARRAAGFGLEVVAYDPYIADDHFVAVGARRVDLPTLLGVSDFLSLHVPLTEQTRGMIGSAEFRVMKPGVHLVNTSRGPVIDEGALLTALAEGIVAGAGLDVFAEEPLSPDSPLLQDDRVIVTPHAAFFAEESIVDMQTGAVLQVAAALAGSRPPDVAHLPRIRWDIADRRWGIRDVD
jgi:D-3-phosphoglycerate dehydrogenase / 2-oxoglutarate reductase